MSRNRQLREAEIQNIVAFRDYFSRFKMLSSSVFTWKNLDKVAGFGASNFLEQVLFEDGRACIIKDPELGLMVLRANPSDKVNIYGLPIKIQASSNDFNRTVNFDECVYVMNNVMCVPTALTMGEMSRRLYEIQRTIDTNVKAQKTPILIEGENKDLLTLENLYSQYEGNMPVIFGKKNFDLSNHLNVLKTDAPYIADKLTELKKDVVTEALNYIGIDNFYSEKKERLITDEAKGSEALTNKYLDCFYKTRKAACDMLNETFLKDSPVKVELTMNQKEILKLKDELNDIIENGEGNQSNE